MDEKKKNKHPLDFRRNIRRRAWVLANAAYKRYCDSIAQALAVEELKPEQIDAWTPPQ
jgi:hypothetical protein